MKPTFGNVIVDTVEKTADHFPVPGVPKKGVRSHGRRKEDDVWHQLHGDEALRLLDVDPRSGLTNDEASRRLQKFGFNSITQRPPVPAWLFSSKRSAKLRPDGGGAAVTDCSHRYIRDPS